MLQGCVAPQESLARPQLSLCSFTRWQESQEAAEVPWKALSWPNPAPWIPCHGWNAAPAVQELMEEREKLLLVFTWQPENPRFHPRPKVPRVRVLAALGCLQSLLWHLLGTSLQWLLKDEQRLLRPKNSPGSEHHP